MMPALEPGLQCVFVAGDVLQCFGVAPGVGEHGIDRPEREPGVFVQGGGLFPGVHRRVQAAQLFEQKKALVVGDGQVLRVLRVGCLHGPGQGRLAVGQAPVDAGLGAQLDPVPDVVGLFLGQGAQFGQSPVDVALGHAQHGQVAAPLVGAFGVVACSDSVTSMASA